MVASCGGSDSGGDSATPGSAETTTAPGGEGTTESDEAADVPTVTDAPASGDEADDSSDASGEAPNCEVIFSLAEIEEFFAEPAELTEEIDDSLGQLLCTWGTIEDSEDLEDLGFKTLVVLFYSGDPIPAANFFDPTIYDTVTTIDGIGDLAYATDSLGPQFFFVDEPVGGSLSYTEMAMGTDDPQLRTADDVEQLFRTFHECVT